jgi:hypothetical protein
VNRALIFTTPVLVFYLVLASCALRTTSPTGRLTRLSRGSH